MLQDLTSKESEHRRGYILDCADDPVENIREHYKNYSLLDFFGFLNALNQSTIQEME